MKKTKLIIGLLALILAVKGLTYFSKDNPSTHFSANSFETTSGSCDFAYDETQVLLFKEFGDVFFTKPGEAEKKLEIEQTYIPSGTTIRTAEGEAMIVFEDDSLMSIDANSELKIEFDADDISVLQKAGNVWHRASSMVSDEQSYEVKTPNAVATVRGTIFGISVGDNGELELLVLDGLVGIDQYGSDNEIPAFSVEVSVNQGVFYMEGRPILRDLKESDLQKPWVASHEELNEKWKAAQDLDLPPHAYLKNLMILELHPATEKVEASVQPIKPIARTYYYYTAPKIKTVIQNPEPVLEIVETTIPEAKDLLKELGIDLDEYEGIIEIKISPLDKATTLIEVIEANKILDAEAATLLEIKRLSGGGGGSSPPPPPNVTPTPDKEDPATEDPATEDPETEDPEPEDEDEDPGLELTESESTPNEITFDEAIRTYVFANIFAF
jgi:FecR protein